MGEIVELPPIRVHFMTTSKEGMATLVVDHVWSQESLTLPLVPSDAVPDALPLLEPAIAHYVAQWPLFMVPDANETDARGFWIEAAGMPEHVAPPENWERLKEICWAHIPDHIKDWLGGNPPDAVFVADPTIFVPPDYSNITIDPDDLGIVPLP